MQLNKHTEGSEDIVRPDPDADRVRLGHADRADDDFGSGQGFHIVSEDFRLRLGGGVLRHEEHGESKGNGAHTQNNTFHKAKKLKVINADNRAKCRLPSYLEESCRWHLIQSL